MMIVGEAWGEQEELQQAPFVGPAGHLLAQALSYHGIAMNDCYLTNVFNLRPKNDDINFLCGSHDQAISNLPAYDKGKFIRAEFTEEIERLYLEVEEVNPNCILALGKTAVWALCSQPSIQDTRGYIGKTTFGSPRKVVATWHPTAALRNYKFFPVMVWDIAKAVKQDETPDFPVQKGSVILSPTLEDLWQYHDEQIAPAPFVACDIETSHNTITEVGFATSSTSAIVVPFLSRPNKNYWEFPFEEKEAWNFVRHVLATKKTVGQNYAYDLKYLWRYMGIPSPNFVGDTMLMHHALQPELEKGLAFLASVYTSRPRWKYMRAESKTSKKGD